MTQEEDNIVELVNALMSENKRLKERVRDLEGKLGGKFIIDDPIPDKDNESNSTECAQLDTKFAYIEGRLQGHDQVIAKVNEWMDLHEAEILTLWEKAQKGEKLGRIEPLR
jgi:hypothetical protein